MGLTTDRSAISAQGYTYPPTSRRNVTSQYSGERARTMAERRSGRREPWSTHPPPPLNQGADLRSRWTRQAGRTY
eukprot:3595686-Pleurochrysis_carterae.AAC.2